MEREAHDIGQMLTDRDLVILALYANGDSPSSVASQIGYSYSWVVQRMMEIRAFLDVPNTAAVVARAIRMGFIVWDVKGEAWIDGKRGSGSPLEAFREVSP